MTPPPLDPSSVASALIGALIGAELASYVGPYAVIAAGGAAGACFALSRMPPSGRAFAYSFVAAMTALSLMLTASIAEMIHYAFPGIDVRWLLVPVALIVGGIGHDWPNVGGWIVTRAGRLFERRTGIDGAGK